VRVQIDAKCCQDHGRCYDLVPPQQRVTRMSALFYYLLSQVHDHLSDPREDPTTYLINAELGGRELDPSHIVGTMALPLIAGIDTTWSVIGASLWQLAKTSQDRRRLAADPGLLPTAIEEFLRAYAPVTMAQLVDREVNRHAAFGLGIHRCLGSHLDRRTGPRPAGTAAPHHRRPSFARTAVRNGGWGRRAAGGRGARRRAAVR
jgi:cytochrome P450